MVDPWSAGYYGEAEERTLRLARAIAWMRAEPNDNGYTHPVEGLLALVDHDAMKVVKIEDNGVVPLPTQPGNYSTDYIDVTYGEYHFFSIALAFRRTRHRGDIRFNPDRQILNRNS